LKGSVDCHIPNDKYRKAYESMRKACGCKMGEKCQCPRFVPVSEYKTTDQREAGAVR